MAHAEKCPVCGGTGRNGGRPTDEGPCDCIGCQGKGFVTILDGEDYKAMGAQDINAKQHKFVTNDVKKEKPN